MRNGITHIRKNIGQILTSIIIASAVSAFLIIALWTTVLGKEQPAAEFAVDNGQWEEIGSGGFV